MTMERTYEGFIKNLFKKTNVNREEVEEEPLTKSMDIEDEDIIDDENFDGIPNKQNTEQRSIPTIQDIKDCFTDLTDFGFSVIVDANATYISIRKKEKFLYSDVKECLLFAIPYLQDEYGMKLKGGMISHVPVAGMMMKVSTSRETFKNINGMNNFLRENSSESMHQIDFYIYIEGLTKKE